MGRMERFNALGRGTQLMLVGAVLLLIDLFLPWQDFDLGGVADALGVDASFSGWRGLAGVILGLLTIVLLAWIIVRIASVNIPLPVSTAMTAALIGTLILIFAVIKILTILGDESTIWSWIGLGLAILIAVGAFQTVQEAGGVETLKSEASSLGSAAGADTSSPSAAPTAEAPPAPAAEPPAPPPPAPPAPPPPPMSEAAAPESPTPEPEAPAGEPSTERGA
jgi:hypothetical protein